MEAHSRAASVSSFELKVHVERVAEATPKIHAALARLLPQLNPGLELPDMVRLQRLIADPAVIRAEEPSETFVTGRRLEQGSLALCHVLSP